MMVWSFLGKIHYGGFSVFFAHRKLEALISSFSEDRGMEVPTGDVMEGHFVVFANKDQLTKRFVVDLHYLSDPVFLGLLERAKEEYGFKQRGPLVIPCHPRELENILEERRKT
ncbi:Small auxin-up RNA [Sesbania bispinosa]|nr:Small auxin-up RNA [Sesbania bispinosa]